MAKRLQILGELPNGVVDPSVVEKIVNDYLDKNPPSPGEAGVSPTVTITDIEGGYKVTITDVNGPKTFEILNGSDGKDGINGVDGADGKDGYTPVKGTDYFTDEDVDEIAQKAADLVTIDQVTPDQVIFPDGVQTTYEIGKVKLQNGIAELVPVGGNLNDFFNNFIDEKNPTTTQPSVSLTFSQAKAYEVGTKVTPSYSASLSAGSYTYGPATGVTATAWSVKDTSGNTKTTASGSFPELTVTDGISYKITATATHGAGTVPVTNTGNDYTAGQIPAGSKSATSGAITGYRNTFYGTLTAKTDPTSSVIRGLTGKSGKSLAAGNSFTITVPVGALRVMFAYPATLRDVNSVKDVNGMNAEIASGFTKSTVSVYGANSHTAISYKVYIMDFANANDKANKFTVTI